MTAAGDAAAGRVRKGGRATGQERHVQDGSARPEEGRAVHLSGRRRQDDVLRHRFNFRRSSIRRRNIPRSSRCTAGPASGSNVPTENFVDAERDRRVRVSHGLAFALARVPGMGKRTLDARLPQARRDRDGRHGAGIKALWTAPVFRQGSRRDVWHILRRIHVGDDDPAAPGVCDGRLGIFATHRLVQLRLDLHRAVHVDSEGEQGGLRSG